MAQSCWAEIEHDLGYKSAEAIPPTLRRRFSRVASLLEIADQEFVSTRAAATTAREDASSQSFPIDGVSLESLVLHPTVRWQGSAKGRAGFGRKSPHLQKQEYQAGRKTVRWPSPPPR